MQIKLVQRKNPLRPQDEPKWYANVVKSGTFTIDKYSTVLSRNSTLTRGDIKNTVASFADETPTYLMMGQSVQLGELGTLRLSAESEGASTKEEFKTGSVKLNIIFTPGASLKKAIKDIELEVINRRENTEEEEEVNP